MAEHPHGDVRRYRYGGCRCGPCRAANAASANRYRMGLMSGTHRRDVHAEPVRQHVQRLQNSGLGIPAIAELAGLDTQRLSALMYGHPSKNQPPSKTVRPSTADKILAVHAGQVPTRGWLPAVGTRRRLQALAAIGWPIKHVGELAGLPDAHAHRILAAPDGGRVKARTARAVAAVYDRLWNVDPAGAGQLGASIRRVKKVAAAKGWLPPVAWDDLIDLIGEDLEAELRRRVRLMDDGEIAACHYAHRRHGDQSPLMVAAAREYDRRRVREHRKKSAA
ncbi:hypothetical protein ACIBQX_11650 [Nonomuraea sp. NPDC049714]|uniref:hypothetical protein n=1 Tax=Nonomuraea sp. NPDC049714 TaxID=3364357 RepID=UPI00378C7CB4